MNKEFKVDENSTLVEYRGTKRSFEILRGGDVISRITTWYRDNVTQVTVPGNIVKHIGFKAFKGCVDVREITLEEGVQSVELGAFWDTNLEELWMPHSMRSFSVDSLPIREQKVTLCVNYSRGAWAALKKAGFVLKKIPQVLWEKHSGLFIALKLAYKKAVRLNIHVQGDDLANYEFLGMPIDCTITFHSAIRAKYIFQRSMPTAVVIEKGVSYIDPDAFSSSGEVFFEDTSIEEFNVVTENPVFYSKDGVLYEWRNHTLLRFPQGKILLSDNCFCLPADTREVAAGAFDGAYTIEKLVIPKGVILMENALVNMPKLDVVWREEQTEA